MFARLIAGKRLGVHSRAFALHVAQKIGTLTIGPLYVSDWGRRLRARFATPHRERPAVAAAIVAHVYYPDLIPEILDCRAVLGGEVPVFLTVPVDKVAAVEQAIAGVAGVTIVPGPNRGRDIAPFLMLLSSGALDGFDAVLKIHTKRSPHLLDGETRRKLLFQALCGERNATWRALSAFEALDTGLVGWSACYRAAPAYWMANEARVRALVARFVGAGTAPLGFFEGSMFWVRPAALEALVELELSVDDFEPEEGQVDGMLHHALERCFTIAAWSSGFSTRDLKGRVLLAASHPQPSS